MLLVEVGGVRLFLILICCEEPFTEYTTVLIKSVSFLSSSGCSFKLFAPQLQGIFVVQCSFVRSFGHFEFIRKKSFRSSSISSSYLCGSP